MADNSRASTLSVFDRTNHEVYIVSTEHAGKRWGFLATWVMPLTLCGSLREFVVAVSVHNTTWPVLWSSRKLALQMLTEDQVDRVVSFGTTSSKDHDKFAGLKLDRRADLPVLEGCAGFVEATITAAYPSSSHHRMLVVASSHTSFMSEADVCQPLTMGYIKKSLSTEDLDRLASKKKHLSDMDKASFG